MANTQRLAFQISLWRPWLVAIAPLALLAAFGFAFALLAGRVAIAVGLLIGFAGVALVLLLPIGLATRKSRWYVEPKGIGGPNNMLIDHWLAWPEIESVTSWPIPGYRYLHVNATTKRRAFWLPLFLTDMPRFRAAVAQYAPPENPLRIYLEQHPA